MKWRTVTKSTNETPFCTSVAHLDTNICRLSGRSLFAGLICSTAATNSFAFQVKNKHFRSIVRATRFENQASRGSPGIAATPPSLSCRITVAFDSLVPEEQRSISCKCRDWSRPLALRQNQLVSESSSQATYRECLATKIIRIGGRK